MRHVNGDKEGAEESRDRLITYIVAASPPVPDALLPYVRFTS
jgi:hypothetical protein